MLGRSLSAILLLLACAGGSALTLSARPVAPSRAGCISMGVKLRAGDSVKVISGDDKGKVAKLLSIDKKKGKVLVEGVNIRTKHVKPMKEGESGNLLKKEMPISISNVALDKAAPAPEPAAAAE